MRAGISTGALHQHRCVRGTQQLQLRGFRAGRASHIVGAHAADCFVGAAAVMEEVEREVLRSTQ